MVADVNRAASLTDLAAISPRSANDTVLLIDVLRTGVFVWDAANRSTQVGYDSAKAVYVPPSSDTSGASGVWVRRFEDELDVEWFGIVGDGTTDNSNAMDALLIFLVGSKGAQGSAIYPAVFKVRFGLGKYYFSRPINLKVPVIFEGITPMSAASQATLLDFATGGFVCHRFNTKAATSGPEWALADSPTTTGADGSIFRNLYCISRQSRPSDDNYAAQAMDGLLAFCPIQVDNCVFESFTRDGLGIRTTNVTGTGINGNADMAHLEGVHATYNGRHGIYLDGIDSNQITCRRCNVRYNNNWGIYDSGFLANQHYDHHAAYNGLAGATIWPGNSKGDTKTSVVRYPNTAGAGTDYYVNPGQAGPAVTTTPGTNNTIWVKQNEGAGTLSPDAGGRHPSLDFDTGDRHQGWRLIFHRDGHAFGGGQPLLRTQPGPAL